MAISFNGTNQYLLIADDAALSLGSAFTLSAWVYRSSGTGTAERYVAFHGAYNTNNSWLWNIYDASHATSANKSRFRIKDSAGTLLSALSTGTIPIGEWVHLAWVCGDGVLRCYINGVEQANTFDVSGLSFPINPAGSSLIGRADGAYYYFAGNMADLAKWDHALTTPNLANLTAGQSPLAAPLGLSWVMPGEKTAGAWKRNLDTGLWAQLTVTNNGATITDGPNVERFEHRITGRSAGLFVGMGV